MVEIPILAVTFLILIIAILSILYVILLFEYNDLLEEMKKYLDK